MKKTLRDGAQQLIYKIINPVVKGLIRIGFTPNMVTTTGLLLNAFACVILIYAAFNGERGDYSYVGWAGAIILFAGLFDMLDGQVARLGNMSSRFGALFDSVLDRYSELFVLFGISYYLILQGYFYSSLCAFFAVIGSMMVSYVRARAEGLGIQCKEGFMQRPERVVIISVGAIACGVFYSIKGDYKIYVDCVSFPVFEPIMILVIPVAFVAVFANITAIGRMRHCARELKKMEQKS